ncbi:unnamed protein product [Lupinus luteus]|uniref:BHLH domain-containing protein n=1 Tax=Lupinus luteus TaxID=3873 RepID=A0AAV1YB57_LUPLU
MKSLKTHDFLQPLERAEAKPNTKEEEARDEISPSVEHLLPGGIGTYSISHVSYFNNNNNNQRVPKPEASLFAVNQGVSTDRNDENSNCSSYTSSGFTLWEDSVVKKGKTGKENNVSDKPILGESVAKPTQWTLSDRTSQSFSNNHHNSFNSRSSAQVTGQKNQSFLEMMKSAKDGAHDEDLKNEETFFLKKESQTAELKVEVDGRSIEQKPDTPRSKHSATEQRRRSKINDRFHMLRELIPHSDQKRDKASFLLEVIEYIHFLQEKVHKYEGSFQGWNHDPEKLMPWRNNDKPSESFEHGGTNSGPVPSPSFLFASKTNEKNIAISQTILGSTQNVESGLSTATNFKPMDHIPNSPQPNFFSPTQSGVVSQLARRLSSDAENAIYQPFEECRTMMATSEKLKDKELTIEGGAISISSVYSKGLLDTLTHALQSSGVDLSQTSMSVQIELGKQANIRPTVPMSMCGAKGDEVPSNNERMMRSRVASSAQSDQAVKKLKTCRT